MSSEAIASRTNAQRPTVGSAPAFAVGLGPGDHRLPCPSCGRGPRDDTLSVTINPDGASGVWHCHRCGDAGNWTGARGPRFNGHARAVAAPARPDRSEGHAAAAERAAARWNAARAADPAHPYLARKGVGPHGLRQERDTLLVPIREPERGALVNLQTIAPDGTKRFLPGGRVKGCRFAIGQRRADNPRIVIAEGFATGASVNEATGLPVFVAFNAGNLPPAAQAMREKYPDAQVIVAADDDRATEGNPGITKAIEAARAVGALLARPIGLHEGETDMNDLARRAGLDAVRASIDAAAPPDQPALIWARAARPLVECDYVVKGMLDTGGLGLVYGASGSGKTNLTIDIACRVAARMPWRGRRVRGGLVIYIAAEAGVMIQRRIFAWRQQHAPGEDFPLAVKPRAVALNDPDAVAEAIALVRAAEQECGERCVLVVIDTLSRSIAGLDENSDLPHAVAACDRLRDELGCATLLVHHTGKDATKGPRGHSSLFAAVDFSLFVSVDEGGARTATVDKARDAMTGEQFPFKLRPVPLGVDADGDPVATVVVEHEREDETVIGPDPRRAGESRRAERLPGPAAAALAALDDALEAHGEPMPGTSVIPAGVRGVRIAVWRDRFRLRYGDDPPEDDSPERRDARYRTAFRRAKDALIARGRIGLSDPWVWKA